MGNEPPSLSLPSAPYRGIEPFRFVDQPIFSARADEVRKLVRLITIYRGIFFYGESGAGKSSLINAGLIPALRDEGFVAERVRVQPIAGQELVIERIALTDEGTPPFLPSRFAASTDKQTPEPARVVLSVEEFVRCVGKPPLPQRQDGNSTLVAVPVLIFDQFEELVTLFEEAPDSREKFNQAREIEDRLVEMLLRLLGDPNLSIKLVLSFREDYLAKISRRLAAAPQLGEQAFRLSFPPETVLRKIIRGPFESATIPAGHFSRRLSEPAFNALESAFRELSDTGTINLTEVQIACLALWENDEEEKAFLKEGEHREAVRRLFGNYLDRALNRLEHKFRKPAITALTFLVTSSGTRNIVSEDDLLGNVVREDHLTQPDAREVLKALSRTTRLVFRQTRGDSAFYEISSEFLIPWITEKRQARERDEQLEKQQEEHERQQRELAQAQALAAEQKKRADDQAKAADRQRRLTMAMVVVSLVAIGAAVAAGIESFIALAAKKRVNESTSRENVSLARYSKDGGRNGQALAHLAQALRLNSENREASGLAAAMLTQLSWHFPLTGSMRHAAGVNSAQFSPDGQRVVTASEDNTARLWDAVSGKPIGEPMKHESMVTSAQFSPDGQRVVTASEKTARLWDAASSKPIGELMQHEGIVTSAQFSPDGQRVVTASEDKTARLWDAASGKPMGQPMKHADRVSSAQFSPDGQRVVTASLDKTARLWDAASGEPIGEPMKHESMVTSAQFSPDGQRVVTTSERMARLWDAANGKPIGELMQHEGIVTSAQFSPDGQWVVTASEKTARLWDASSDKPLSQPIRHKSLVYAAEFSPDGQRVVTASEDKTARLWDAASGEPIGQPMKHESMVTLGEFSPDGQRVVTASEDNTARLWDAVSGKQIGEPMKHADRVSSAQFSPDGQRVVTASERTAWLWDAANGKSIGQPMKHADRVSSAQFSPDGQRVVTASEKTAWLWDAASGKPIGEPIKGEETAYSVRFSPDGQRVVIASGDTAWLGDVVIVTYKDTEADIVFLAELAEATGGVTLETVRGGKNLKVLTPEQIEATRGKIAAKYVRMSSGLTPLQRFMKWSVSDRRSRAISPFLQGTVSKWVEDRITEGTVEGLRSAMQVDPANARLSAHLGRRLADEVLKLGSDPDEARRARGEADFLTSRAQRLAPDNDEIKKLRDEVTQIPSTTLGPTGTAITSVPLLEGHAIIRYNPTLWQVDRTVPTLPNAFQLVHHSGEVWVKVVAEPGQIGMEDIAELSLNQVKNSDPMAKVTRKGSRRVNGLNMVFQEIEATVLKLPFTFYNHYYSDSSSCIQFLGWTRRSLMEKRRSTIEEFLEGFEVPAVTPKPPSPEIKASPPRTSSAPKPSSTVTGEETPP